MFQSLKVPGRRLLADGKSSSGQSVGSSFGSRHLSDVGLAACSQVTSEKGKEKGEDPCRSQSAQRGLL